ncbi:hypothetical protein KI385_14505 [Streptomyces inhibens]|nr:hypothetical protein [Streptomyces inhibens]UKY49910.1 hypothetical protein KI385_14505 [Streptomyces inhibens]
MPPCLDLEVVAALLERDHHLVRAVILADKGFAGRKFEVFLTERLGVRLVHPDRKNEPVDHSRLVRVRQWTKAASTPSRGSSASTTPWQTSSPGVFARPGQRLLALAPRIWHNWTTGLPV